MSTPYLGQVYLFAGNFAPRNYAYCSGQLMNISQNSALFSLLGTYYGGNGTSTFGLPDLRGRIPVGQGQGPGLSNYTMGQQFGTENVTITQQTLPAHNHMLTVTNLAAGAATPVNHIPAAVTSPFLEMWVSDANKTGNPIAMLPTALSQAGSSQPHNNVMPILAISMVIALQGIFPSRN